ncbi:TPA: hypothetical protein J8G71_004647 [Escherichia coli]|nr:hypothetical protein [Escherichia coli]HAZ6358609.1 hypothetical protein [Escherichia coli]HAZ6439100.1 hypothetical protein [Escherichia coli]HAZ7592798.1 hypothetical protein [Escherichia coli]
MTKLMIYGTRNEGWLKPFMIAVGLVCANYFMKLCGVSNGRWMFQIWAVLIFFGIGIKACFIETISARIMRVAGPILAALLLTLLLNELGV